MPSGERACDTGGKTSGVYHGSVPAREGKIERQFLREEIDASRRDMFSGFAEDAP